MKRFTIEYVRNYAKENTDVVVLSTKYVNSKSKMRFLCSCGEEFSTTFGEFKYKNKRQCNKCGYKITVEKLSLTQEEFKQRVYNLVKNEYTVLGDYKGDSVKIKMRHNKCGNVYLVSPGKFTGVDQRRCPRCNGGSTKDNQYFLEQVKDLGHGEYEALETYINANTPIKFIHKECGNVFKMPPKDFLNSGNRCPACASSKGEKRIARYLKSNSINFKQEYRIKECRYKRPLPFDFAVFDNGKLSILIEFDGEGHFKPFRFSDKETMSKKLQITIRNDNIKNNYCKNNNIELLRIPYYKFDDIENILNTTKGIPR